MAMEAADKLGNSGNGCGICRQKYKPGRPLRVLACSHTFCLPCLSEIQHTAKRKKKNGAGTDSDVSDSDSDSDGDNGDKNTNDRSSTNITCPTCRSTVPLPPAGVSEFQSSMASALESEPSKTASEQQNALLSLNKLRGKDARVINTVDSLTDDEPYWYKIATDETNDQIMLKVKGQVKVMEDLLDQLKKQEQDLDQQWEAVERDVNARYAAALGLLAGARNECLSSLRIVGQEAKEKQQEEMKSLRDSHSKLSHFTKENLTSANPEASLMDDDDLKKLQERVKDGSVQSFFKYKAHNVSSTTLENFLQDYMGTVLSAEQSSEEAVGYDAVWNVGPEPKPESEPKTSEEPVRHSSKIPAESVGTQELDLHSSDLENKVDYLIIKYTALEAENSALRHQFTSVNDTNVCLALEVARLKQGNAQMNQNMALIQQGYNSFFTLHGEVSNMRNEMNFQQVAVGELRSQLTAVQWELSHIKINGASLQAAINGLQQKMAVLEKPSVDSMQSGKESPDVSSQKIGPQWATAPPHERKQLLGERLFPLIHHKYPTQAGQLTGMLLEMDNAQLLHFLEDEVSLNAKVEEAAAVLSAYEAKQRKDAEEAKKPC